MDEILPSYIVDYFTNHDMKIIKDPVIFYNQYLLMQPPVMFFVFYKTLV